MMMMNWGIPGSTSWHRSPAPKSSHLLLVTHTVLPSQFINSFLTYPANRQTNIQMQKHNLLGGGKNDNFFSDPHSMPVKVKLPYSDSPEVVIPGGGNTAIVSDTWPVLCQTYGYLPAWVGTKLYCLVTEVHEWTACPRLHPKARRPRVELSTCRSQVQRPNHYATESHSMLAFIYIFVANSTTTAVCMSLVSIVICKFQCANYYRWNESHDRTSASWLVESLAVRVQASSTDRHSILALLL